MTALRTGHPARRGAAVIVVGLAGVLILVAALQFLNPSYGFPHVPLDEQGHFSYTLYLLKTGAWWPDFAAFPLYDADGTDTGVPNFVNHPPMFYWLMAVVQRLVPLPSGSAQLYRIVPLGFFVGSVAALAGVAMVLRLDRFGALAIMLTPLALSVPLFAPFYSNDTLALLGGSLTCLGTALWLVDERPAASLLLVALGLVLASTKMNALLLTGVYAACVLPCGRQGFRARPRLAAVLLSAAAVLAGAPFAVFALTQGSPVPNGSGQDAMLRAGAAANGWLDAPRLEVPGYLWRVLPTFAEQTNGASHALVASGLLAVVLALAGSWLLPARGAERAPILMGRAAAVATLLTLVPHLAFAYGRYRRYGWLGDMYPRYYFPLVAAYGLAVACGARAAWATLGRLVGRVRPPWTTATTVASDGVGVKSAPVISRAATDSTGPRTVPGPRRQDRAARRPPPP